MVDAVIQPSFAAGELSPSAYGRVDLAKYHSGVALARNFYVDYRGGLSSRFGTAFVGQCKDSATANRLIPFTYSTLQTYVLVFGHLTMRVVKNGAYVTQPLKAITNISQASPGIVNVLSHGYATGDLVFLSGITGMTQMNGRFGTVVVVDVDHFSLIDMYGVPISTVTYGAYTLSGAVGRVFTLVTPYAAADLALLKYSQSADTMTLNHPNYPEQQLTRTQHWVWTITPSIFVSTTPIPANVAAVPSDAAGTTVYRYVVTSVSANGVTESLASNLGIATGVTLSAATVGHNNTVTWTGNPGDTLYNIYRTPENPASTPGAGAIFGYVGSTTPATANVFIDNNILPDFTRTPPIANNPFAVGAIKSIPVTAGGAAYTGASSITITDATGTGAVVLPIIVGGAITAVIVTVAGQNYTAPTFATAGPGAGATFGAAVLSPVNNPSCATYFQQRQVRGALTNRPQGLVFSKTADYLNMNFSTPSRANDEVDVTLSSQTVNPIKHMVPLTSLIVLTGSGAWRVDGGSQSDAITPDHINAVPQAYNGCSDVPPIVINYDILYVQAKGSIVRDLSYNFYVNVYTGEDISMLANHLFYGHQIVEWCWAEEPFKIVWAVRDDGIMLSLTFLKEQQIYGWARHDTLGLYKSICSISEGNENAVYVIVQRLVNGQYLQYIERFASRNMGGDTAIGIPADVTKAWCVDCGLQYPLAYPAATLTATEPTNVPVIGSVYVISGGAGYSLNPVISVSDPTGVGAVFQPVVAGGVVTQINVTNNGQNYTNPVLTITDPSGTGALANAVLTMPVPMNASAALFSIVDVGKVVRINNGLGTVLSVPSSTQIVVNVSTSLTSTWPSPQGAWSMTAPVSAVSGLDHLNGQTVAIVVDGNVQPPQAVMGGNVTLQTPGTAITIGLPYVCQLQTLNLDIQGGPTIQGKRKKLSAVTVRVQDSRGLKVGPTFNSLVEIKERTTEKMGQPITLKTTDERVNIMPAWTVEGRMCLQQDQPLPSTVLALIPEIEIGDT